MAIVPGMEYMLTQQTEAEVKAEAQTSIDNLKELLKKNRAAFKAGIVDSRQFKEDEHKFQERIKGVVRERDKKIAWIRIKITPEQQAEFDSRMQADMEKRRYDRFMAAAGPALEAAIDLEDTE